MKAASGGCFCGDLRFEASGAPDQFSPIYEVWMVRRDSWQPPFVGLERLEQDREGP